MTSHTETPGLEPVGDLAQRWLQQSGLDRRRPAATVDNVCPSCATSQLAAYAPGAPEERREVTTPEAAAELLVPAMQHLDREHCVTLNLDTKHRLISSATVSIGSIDHTFMSPREIFRDALLRGASAVIVAHNHPSGDAEPSRDDEAVTRRLVSAGEVIGVEVLDHLVIGHQRWTSLSRRGLLQANDLETRNQRAAAARR